MPRTPSSPATAPSAPAREIVVYENDGGLRLDVPTDGETVWLTQDQMCRLFGRERSVITKHISNIFKEGELPMEGYVQILHKTSPDGGRPVTFYNLDVIISVGYRVKSVQGTRFRQWATRTLRDMLLRKLDEVKRISSLERRMDKTEAGLQQVQAGVNYLVQQLSIPPSVPPKRKIGFQAHR